MNQEDITRMAREAGFVGFDGSNAMLCKFAALVAAHKREWVGLTEKEVKAIANKRNDYGLPMTGRMWVFVADLTDKLKEKNHG